MDIGETLDNLDRHELRAHTIQNIYTTATVVKKVIVHITSKDYS